MKHSIFRQIIAVFVAAIALASIVAGIFSFVYNSGMVVRRSSQYARAGALSAAQVIENLDFEKLKESDTSELYTKTREVLRAVCKSLDLEYLYIYEVNQRDRNVIRFVMTVASDDAHDENVAEVRGLGAVVPRVLTEQERMALLGEEHPVPYIEHNAFGDVYSWYYPIYDSNGNVSAIIGSDYSTAVLFDQAVRGTLVVIVSMIAVLLLVLMLVMIAMRRRIFVPIKLISNRMKGFVSDGGANFEPLGIRSGDEMQEIADSFEKMSADISEYLNSIERLTAERVQANVELEIASRIQCGIVPEQTALADERYEAYAVARPAREVGGDFYDCFTRGGNSVCIVTGDVSGKGVAAAMFMAMAKTMLKDCLQSGMSPADALNTANDALCKSNPEGMFATVFAAVLDADSGVLSYANAGHTRPVIFGRNAEFLDVDSGIALGLFEDAGIIDCTVSMEKNSGILIYTDGVTEAVNPRKEFFGEERLLSAVSGMHGAEQCVEALSAAVRGFSDDAEQFDDYTALALYYSGGSTVRLKPELSALSDLRGGIFKNAGDNARKIYLACEEVFVNIASYSGASAVEVSYEKTNGGLIVEFSDDGTPFNPVLAEQADKEFDELDGGGMGIGLVKQLTDRLEYKNVNGRNILTLEFALSADGAEK